MANSGWYGEGRRHAEAARKRRTSSPADEHAANELINMFAVNDESLYRTLMAWKANFERKKKSGVFNKELAIKGLANNYLPVVINKYRHDFPDNYSEYIGHTVSQTTKNLAAEYALRWIESD